LDCVNDSRLGFNRGVGAIDAAKGPIDGWAREATRLSGLTGEDADRLPCFGLPWRSGDGSVPIYLNVLMQMVYESAALDLTIDYGQQPTPGLSQDDFDWVQKMVAG
jgi:Protein of unknown function (DUF4058)